MAGTLKDDLLPLLDELRGLPGQLGFRPYQVWIRKTEWSGSLPGRGTQAFTETRLLVGGGQDPKVVEVHRKDIAAGSGELIDVEYDVGPLTPSYSGGGIDPSVINPPQTGTPTEILFLLKGQGLPAEGLLCKKVSDVMDRSLRIVFRVRSIGRKRPAS